MSEDCTPFWVRNPSDEMAVADGCRFNEERGAYTVWWIERFCRLYEGELAGEPLHLWGCHQCGIYGLQHSHEFNEWNNAAKINALKRAAHFCNCVADGHEIDWQYDCTMRMFGWEAWSDHWNRMVRRFRESSIWVPKKNKKTPTAAAHGLYLTCGDGEQGAKTFFGAKDGKQARGLSCEHAKQMVLQSEDLYPRRADGKPTESICKINEGTMRISYLPTSSYLEPISSANSRTQESKEGLNGNVILDEVHVVDVDLVRRISRAGISRSEPMNLEISTAGNNPDSYGRQRCDHARDVMRGKVKDQKLFAAVYEVPQDATHEQIKEDPLKFGRMANPAMGQSVNPQEFLDDFTNSQKTIQDWLDFLMYRLNIWQKGSNPWLRETDWTACKKDFAEDDLEGQPCWAGLDLARTKDMCSLVLTFRDSERDEHFFQLPYFWLPENRAMELGKEGVKLEWGRGGFLELTPGDVTDYNAIKRRVRQLATVFDFQELTFDPKFAEELTQAICDGDFDDQGNCIVPGLGIERFAFPQTDDAFAAPTADYERLVLAHQLHHNGHPVLSWQAGHVQVMVKTNKVKRAVKPKANSPKTIDGIIAGIMALGRCMQAEDASWFKPSMMRD